MRFWPITILMSVVQASSPPPADRARVETLVAQVQRADYQGDRAALARLHDELAPFLKDDRLASRIAYWRGFAMWRRAFNGFNESADPKVLDLDGDLTRAVADFDQALAGDPAFVDAKVGKASCVANLAFLNRKDATRGRDLLLQSGALLADAINAAPDNPRALWVLGANQWYAPPERGGGESVAMATYTKGLEAARSQKGRAPDPLEPSWGEPELLMNLAFANLTRHPPTDVAAAERYAREALALVPYWHYVRDILMVQIRDAKAK